MADHFYVTVKDGSRTGWLAGPFGTRAAADESLPMVKEAACARSWEGREGRAWFYHYGVTRVYQEDGSDPKVHGVVFPGMGAHLLDVPAMTRPARAVAA